MMIPESGLLFWAIL